MANICSHAEQGRRAPRRNERSADGNRQPLPRCVPVMQHERVAVRVGVHEVEALRKNGLAQGGSLDNALVFAPEGALTPLRWPDEPARHKMLDLIGDLALFGPRLQASVAAFKASHALHTRAVARLRATQLTIRLY